MLSRIVHYGIIAGLTVGIPMFGMVLLLGGHPPYGMVIGYSIMLIALSSIFVGVKRHRDADRGGVIGFWPAFALGLGISFVAGVIYVISWESAVAVTHMDFATDYARSVIAHQQAKGVTGEALAKVTAEMEHFKVQYANPFYRLPMTFAEIFPVGVLVSLIAAALFRNSRFLPARRTPSPSASAA